MKREARPANKTLLVLRYEMGTVLRSKSFLFTALGLPLLGVLIVVGVSLLKGDGPDLTSGASGTPDASELQVEGYVDLAGLIQAIPADTPQGVLVAYPDEASAQRALRTASEVPQAGSLSAAGKQIAAYYVIPPDYVETGDLIYVNPDYRMTSPRGQSWVMQQVIVANLLGNDPERIAQARQPMDVQVRALAPAPGTRGDDGPLAFYIPYATMMIFYVTLIMAASLLLNSVSKEKQDRVMEVVLLSASPQQMLAGKIVGLGLLGLLQTAIWLGTGYALLHIMGQRFSLPPGFELPPAILGWGLVLFVLGYAVYASLMAGLGALVPNLKEAGQAVIVVIWPLLLPLFFLVSLIEKPHGAIAVGLSLFPLTAPVAMMTRLAASEVPWWQPLLAVVLLLGTAVWIVRAVSRMFRAQHLLSGQPPSIRRYLKLLLGRRST